VSVLGGRLKSCAGRFPPPPSPTRVRPSLREGHDDSRRLFSFGKRLAHFPLDQTADTEGPAEPPLLLTAAVPTSSSCLKDTKAGPPVRALGVRQIGGDLSGKRPTRTRTRYRDALSRQSRPEARFMAESFPGLVRPRHPRGNDDADVAVPWVGRVDDSPLSRRTLVSPLSIRVALPRRRLAPVSDATNGSRGSETSSRGSRAGAARVDNHADSVGESGRIFVVVRDDQRGQLECAQDLLELDSHVGLCVGVERGRAARPRGERRDHAQFARARATR